MSSNGNNPPTFPDKEKFDGSNFVGFKSRVHIATRVRGATGYLMGATKQPSPLLPTQLPPSPTEWTSSSPSLDEWGVRDAWVLALILYNTNNPIGLGVKLDGTAAEAWESVTSIYGSASELGAAKAERDLRTIVLVDGGDFEEHVKVLQSKWNSATDKGTSVNDKAFHAIVLASLPASWNVIVSMIYSTKTSAEAISVLSLHWERLKRQGALAGTATTALQAKTTQAVKPKLICINTNCGRTGHTINNCY